MRVWTLSEDILDATDTLTGQAANLAGTPDARYVNIAGRNRMLSQRIGKFFLFRERVGNDDIIVQQLDPSCREFESNLEELRCSGKNLPELAAQLREVTAQWQKFMMALVPNLAHGQKAKHAQAVFAEGDRLLRHVDTTVRLYERLTK